MQNCPYSDRKQLQYGQNAKFSIWRTQINNQDCYYAKVVDTDLESYKILKEVEKEEYFGVHVTNSKQRIVYYRDHLHLKADIISKYGREWLQPEI